MGKHTKKREKKLAQDRRLIEANSAVNPLARAVEERLPLDGSIPMRGNLLLPSSDKPAENVAAAPTKWVEDRLDTKANTHGHPYAPDNHGHGDRYADKNHPHNYAPLKHNHPRASISFKRDLSLEEQKEFLGLLAEVDTLPEDRTPNPDEWHSFLSLFKWFIRLTTDDPEFSGEELVAFREHGDPEAVAAWEAYFRNEPQLRRALREKDPDKLVQAHFDRNIRRLAKEEGVDIYDIDEDFLSHLPEEVQSLIEKNRQHEERGETPPSHF